MTPTRPGRGFRFALVSIAGFNLVSAPIGMVGLTLGGGMGLPAAWLARLEAAEPSFAD